MQKVLILSWFAREVHHQQEYLKNALPHQEVTIQPIQAYFVGYDGSKLIVEHKQTGETLDDYDVVNMIGWRKDDDLGTALAYWMDQAHVPFIGQTVRNLYPHTKLAEMIKLVDAKLPYVKSVYASRNADIPQALQWGMEKIGLALPVVIKAINASHGAHNFIVRSFKELENLPLDDQYHYIIQEFIPNSFDYRILIVDDRAQLIIKRTRQDQNLHLNNSALGAHTTVYEAEDFDDKEILDLALQAARCFDRTDIAGVDVLRNDETGEPYILEVNKTPNFSIGATEGDVAKKLHVLYTYMDKLAQQKY